MDFGDKTVTHRDSKMTQMVEIYKIIKGFVDVFVVVFECLFDVGCDKKIKKCHRIHKVVDKGIAKKFIKIENEVDTPTATSLFGAHWYFFFKKDFHGKSFTCTITIA